eukprot:12938619-Prorocentrum_lima.AAC.1
MPRERGSGRRWSPWHAAEQGPFVVPGAVATGLDSVPGAVADGPRGVPGADADGPCLLGGGAPIGGLSTSRCCSLRA